MGHHLTLSYVVHKLIVQMPVAEEEESTAVVTI